LFDKWIKRVAKAFMICVVATSCAELVAIVLLQSYRDSLGAVVSLSSWIMRISFPVIYGAAALAGVHWLRSSDKGLGVVALLLVVFSLLFLSVSAPWIGVLAIHMAPMALLLTGIVLLFEGAGFAMAQVIGVVLTLFCLVLSAAVWYIRPTGPDRS